MCHRLCWLLALGLSFFAASSQASFHLFLIDQIYSNADGNIQYIVVTEATGSNGENFWAGHSMSTTNAFGQMKQINFASNLASSATARKSVLLATPGFAALGLVTPDYMIPARFIPTDGSGRMNYADVDDIVLPVLPTDGLTAIDRSGNPVPATPKNFAGSSATMTAAPVGNVEFYNASLDHYFISALAPDIDALDSGRLAGWARTGQGFFAYPTQTAGGAGVNPVCRIRIPPELGDSHFYSASPQECADTLTKFPTMVEESPNVFYIALPSTSGSDAGTCPAGTIPVYRVFDNRADANHRYTTDRATRDAMVAKGYIAEGYGDDAVIMCALPGTVSASSIELPEPPAAAASTTDADDDSEEHEHEH